MSIRVENGDINGVYWYMNGYTGSESISYNSIYYAKKINEISTNRYLMKKINYRMVYALVICYLHPHLINMPIGNAIINIINFWSMLTFQHQTNHQFQHWLHLMLHQQMTKDVQY